MTTTLAQAIYDAWLALRPGSSTPSSLLSAQVLEIQVGDYLPSVRGTVTSITGTGTTSTSTRAITFQKKNSNIEGSVTWLATSMVWVGR